MDNADKIKTQICNLATEISCSLSDENVTSRLSHLDDMLKKIIDQYNQRLLVDIIVMAHTEYGDEESSDLLMERMLVMAARSATYLNAD